MKFKFKFQPSDVKRGNVSVSRGGSTDILDMTSDYFKGLVAVFTKVEAQNVGGSATNVTVNNHKVKIAVDGTYDFAPIIVKYGEKLTVSTDAADIVVNYEYILIPRKALEVTTEVNK